MAKLSNFIEQERSFWKIILFVFKHSFIGSKFYSLLRYITAAIAAIFTFLEFGGIAIIVNELATAGVVDARPSMILLGFGVIILAEFLPAINSSLSSYFWDTQGDDLSRYLQSLLFDKRNELDIGTIEQPEFQDMMETVTMRGWSAFFQIITIGTGMIRNITSLVIALVSLAVISPWVILILVIGSIPVYFFEKRNAQLMAQLWRENSEERRMWIAKTSPTGNKHSLIELKNFNLVNIFKKNFLKIISGFHEKIRVINKKQVKIDMFSRIILTIALGISLTLLLYDVRSGAIAIGSLVFSFSVISRFQLSLNNLFDNMARFTEHKKYMDGFMDFLEMKSMIVSGEKIIHPTEFKSIELQNVSFTYPGSETPIVKNISLIINRGEMLAIVGLNGAGKTTLIKLLTRVYDPTEGTILINGIDLREYDLISWKTCLGILLQDYSIYSEETVAENIMLGDTSKHDQTIIETVSKETTAHEFIQELPEKYNQRVGTEFRGGVELSKGQKQKVALSRTLYRDAPIIILDEPTSAIDALAEDSIFKALHEKHTHQTRIIISHKFSNVRTADKIILVEHGQIIEEGSHDELMILKKGKYKELFELQAKGYQK